MLFIKNGDAVSDFPPGANHLQLGKAELAMSQSYDELLTSLKGLAREMNALHQQSARALAPVVEQLIATRSRDVNGIAHTLDRLLDCACHPDGLALFKSLCRHYFSFDPAAAAEYVQIYREMWDSDEKEEQ